MLYRAAILAVAVFCGTMWALLIRSELRPEETAWRAVPLKLVFDDLFQQDQPSDLAIREGSRKVGTFHIRPRAPAEDAPAKLDLSGELDNAATAGRRINWQGALELDGEYRPSKFRLDVLLHAKESGATSLFLEADNRTHRGHYRFVLAGVLQADRDFDLDKGMVSDLLAQLGLPSVLAGQLAHGMGARSQPAVLARQAGVTLHGERVETYLVTVKDGDRTLLEVQISQIGQILQAETFFGWKLTAE